MNVWTETKRNKLMSERDREKINTRSEREIKRKKDKYRWKTHTLIFIWTYIQKYTKKQMKPCVVQTISIGLRPNH